jgi:hypothetical protein
MPAIRRLEHGVPTRCWPVSSAAAGIEQSAGVGRRAKQIGGLLRGFDSSHIHRPSRGDFLPSVLREYTDHTGGEGLLLDGDKYCAS